MHSSVILKNDVKEHAVLFKEIADAMFVQQLYQDALSIYEDLSADEAASINFFSAFLELLTDVY